MTEGPLRDLFERVRHRQAAEGRAKRVVVVRLTCAEHREHGVADELLDGPAEALELAAEPAVVGREQRAHVLRIQPLGRGGEADEVGEEDSDDFPLLAERLPGRDERDAAFRAELRPGLVLVAAGRAGAHAASVTR